MYCIYILRSLKTKKYYIGFTSNLERRLSEHERGKSGFDKVNAPFELVCLEKYKTKLEAYKRELKIKSYKGGNAFKKLIG